MIVLEIGLTLAAMALQSQAPAVGVTPSIGLKTITDCMLATKGKRPPQEPNLSILLPGTIGKVVEGKPAMTSDAAHPILIADPGKLLRGASFTSVNHFKLATLSFVTGSTSDTHRTVLFLTMNKSGNWYDAALGDIPGEPTMFGACFLTAAPDADVEFTAHPPKATM